MPNKHKEEVEISLGSITKNLGWIALVLILIFGFYLRVYHLDYPVIGYHDWKEAHYLTEARNFARTGDWLTPRSDFPDMFTNPEGAHGDTMPLTSWFTAIGFIIFGEHAWVGRLISVLFVMASIFLLYLIIKKLFKRDDLALTAALVAATNPLLVFFGRQVQLDNPALFFAMLSVYTYIIWLEDMENKSKVKYLVLSSLCMVLSFLSKYSFAIFAVPMFALLPFKKIKDIGYWKTNWKIYVYGALPAILIPLWYLNNIRIASANLLSADAQRAVQGDIYYSFSSIFSSTFWDAMRSYIPDNYTFIGLFFAAIGLVLFFAVYRENKGNRFMLVYIAASIPWVWVMASKLSGHSYHQYPIAPLIIMLIAFCFVVVAGSIEKMIKINHIRWIIIIGLFMLLVYPPFFKTGGGIFTAKDRQFDTQFFGLDIAGDYLKKNSRPDERLFFSGHQSFGVIWEADRKGSAGHYNETITRIAEDKYNFRWILVYQWGLQILNEPDKWNYIQSNYSIKQIAFQQTPDGMQPIYMLFEKGGSFNQSNLNELLQKKQQLGQLGNKQYELTQGNVQVVYFDI